MFSLKVDSSWDTYIIVAAFALCLLYGLRNLWYTITVGYGLCVSIQAGIIFVLYYDCIWDNPDRVNANLLLCHLIISIAYALRLVSFITIRSYSKSYMETQRSRQVISRSISGTVCMVFMCGCIYFFMTSPVLAHARSLRMHYPINIPIRIIGLYIMASGLFIESTADMQKSAFKKDHPTSFCSKGLYKYVRMPNYFGEMLFWTGSLVAAFASKMQPYVMISSILGVISSVMIMFASGATLDKKQLQNYGNDPEYLEYRRKTPVIIPLIPFYSLTLEKPKDE